MNGKPVLPKLAGLMNCRSSVLQGSSLLQS